MKPMLWLRVAFNVVKVALLNKAMLRSVDFAPTYACNLKCVHCFAEALKQSNTDTLNIRDYERIAKEAIKLGATHFAIQGGEPLLYPKLEDLIKVLQPQKMFVSITTNGTLLNRARIRRLKEIGVDMLTFSLDDIEAEKHNQFRGGKNSYSHIMEAINLATKEGLQITINTCVTHENLYGDNLQRMIAWTKENGFKLNIVLPVPMGRWQARYDVLMTEEDRQYVYNLLKQHNHVRRDLDSGYFKWGCGAAKEMLYITAYGDVLVCPFIHVSFGNVTNDSLQTIRERALSNHFFAEYYPCCLVAEDMDFIKNYLSKTWGNKNLPVRSSEIFNT